MLQVLLAIVNVLLVFVMQACRTLSLPHRERICVNSVVLGKDQIFATVVQGWLDFCKVNDLQGMNSFAVERTVSVNCIAAMQASCGFRIACQSLSSSALHNDGHLAKEY